MYVDPRRVQTHVVRGPTVPPVSPAKVGDSGGCVVTVFIWGLVGKWAFRLFPAGLRLLLRFLRELDVHLTKKKTRLLQRFRKLKEAVLL